MARAGGGDENTPLISVDVPNNDDASATWTTAKGFWRISVALVLAVCLGIVTLVYEPGVFTTRAATGGDLKVKADKRILNYGFKHDKYILVSLGRSGSTATFAGIDLLTHGTMRPLDKTMLYEILGSSSHAMRKRTDPDRKIRNFFEKKIFEHPTTPTAGFKWKPLVDNEHYDRAWSWCVDNDVKIILMTRNPLDMVISQQKHHDNPHLNPHCHGFHCVKDHAVQVTLPTGDHLSAKMGQLQKHYDVVRGKCETLGGNCFETSYEKLFATDSRTQLAAWRELIAFVQDKSHAKEISDVDITFAVGHSEDTSPGDRSQYVENWDQVEKSVRESIWAGTLDCSTENPGTEKEGCSLPTTGEKRPWDDDDGDAVDAGE